MCIMESNERSHEQQAVLWKCCRALRPRGIRKKRLTERVSIWQTPRERETVVNWQCSKQDPSDLSWSPALVRWMLLCTD